MGNLQPQGTKAEATVPDVTPSYTDDAPHYAARDYPGCFTAEQVRRQLGISCSDGPGQDSPSNRHEKIATPEHHFLPDCICAPLHTRCLDPSSSEGASHDSPTTHINVTLDQLCASSQRGCWFCAAIYGGIRTAPPWDPDLEKETPLLPIFSISAAVDGTTQSSSVSAFGDKERVQEPHLVFYIDGNEATASPCKLFRCKKEPAHTDPHEQLAFTSRALQECLQNHSCVSPVPLPTPTRLLYVQVQDGKYTVRLVHGVPPQPYVALSHCWGDALPVHAKTTRANLSSRASDIPWTDLTQTFRDAVAVTERLGFQYLWVDALCIIQDSPSDWTSEASRMCDVYSNCALLLSADASPNSKAGLFRSANMSTWPWRAGMPAEWGNHAVKVHYDKVHCTFGKMAPMYMPSWKQFQLYPLSTRAWCYQEQSLARRVVHFGVDEVSWDCVGGAECQCGTFGPKGSTFGTHTWKKTAVEGECTPREKHTLWLNTVGQYSELDLSFWTDRLPALSGLAKQYQVPGRMRSGDAEVVIGRDMGKTGTKRNFKEIDLGTYLAGNWSAFLPLDLCWYADYTPGKRLPTVSSYVAPSWSWASVSGMVRWRLGDDDGNDTHELRVELMSARCDLVGADETGQISGGELVLRGRMIPVNLFRGEIEIPGADGLRYAFFHLEGRDPATGEQTDLGHYRPDFYECNNGVKFFAGSHLIWGGPDSRGEGLTPVHDGEYFALDFAASFVVVIRRVRGSHPDAFERVGSIYRGNVGHQWDLSRWFDGVEPLVVKLI
ncbi:heterokaryon incompatibility protein-domain-containing protein [Nemania sp. NC0429]|nr:heterokaryon incompatibility protein-domain-containing protein [Nemania sp. NC0429]